MELIRCLFSVFCRVYTAFVEFLRIRKSIMKEEDMKKREEERKRERKEKRRERERKRKRGEWEKEGGDER